MDNIPVFNHCVLHTHTQSDSLLRYSVKFRFHARSYYFMYNVNMKIKLSLGIRVRWRTGDLGILYCTPFNADTNKNVHQPSSHPPGVFHTSTPPPELVVLTCSPDTHRLPFDVSTREVLIGHLAPHRQSQSLIGSNVFPSSPKTTIAFWSLETLCAQ